MNTYKVQLNSINKVMQFTSIISSLDGDAELSHNGHIVNAKSILGIFSLDLSQVLDLKLENKDIPAGLTRFLCHK